MVKQKQSSSVSSAQMIKALKDMGYVTAHFEEKEHDQPKAGFRMQHKKSYRNVTQAGLKDASRTALSISGKSVHLVYAGEAINGRYPEYEIFVPAKGMLSQNQLKTIMQKTGVRFD